MFCCQPATTDCKVLRTHINLNFAGVMCICKGNRFTIWMEQAKKGHLYSTMQTDFKYVHLLLHTTLDSQHSPHSLDPAIVATLPFCRCHASIFCTLRQGPPWWPVKAFLSAVLWTPASFNHASMLPPFTLLNIALRNASNPWCQLEYCFTFSWLSTVLNCKRVVEPGPLLGWFRLHA